MASKRFITVTAPKKIGTIGALPSADKERKNRTAQSAVVRKQTMGAKTEILGLGRFIRGSPLPIMIDTYYNHIPVEIQ